MFLSILKSKNCDSYKEFHTLDIQIATYPDAPEIWAQLAKLW